jgi:8-oxo-dGTP pyrophosphatase MutT (NUDIX family)
MLNQIVVQRRSPPELVGRWELPAGKLPAGATDPEAAWVV